MSAIHWLEEHEAELQDLDAPVEETAEPAGD
jgi:hypothetical protein